MFLKDPSVFKVCDGLKHASSCVVLPRLQGDSKRMRHSAPWCIALGAMPFLWP